jgi:ATPase subunit of ABC transporter with duplicated ATPase domains
MRYSDRAIALRAEQRKDAGTVRFADSDVTVIADLPKKVEWDQAKLAAIAERIRAAGDNPAEYVEATYKVAERAYTAWPEHIRSAFTAARTVRTGKATYKLSLDAAQGGVLMALRIITADERLAENRGIKACIFGKSGIGKTSLLWSLDPASTLFIDLEAGDLAVQGWTGTSIRPRTWRTAGTSRCSSRARTRRCGRPGLLRQAA